MHEQVRFMLGAPHCCFVCFWKKKKKKIPITVGYSFFHMSA